jgi:hypothetical protein
LRRTLPEPRVCEREPTSTAGSSASAEPSRRGRLFCAPKSAPTAMFSLPWRERSVELRISAWSSISMTMVMMSPRARARLSPSRPWGPELQSEACW